MMFLILSEILFIPCYICAYCQLAIELNKKKFKCFVCQEENLMPDVKGLPISKRRLDILALSSEEVYRGEKVKKLKEHIKKIEENISKLSFGIKIGVDWVKELCLDLKNKVQLKTEEAIEQLNEHNKEMIIEIEEFENDWIKSFQSKRNS